MVIVGSPLKIVLALRVREVIRELIALFRSLHKAEWLASKERIAYDIYTHVTSARCIREAVQQAASRVLEPQLIDLVVSKRPVVLSRDAPVVIILTRRAGECVLSEVLRTLRIHLDAIRLARAHSCAQQQCLARRQLVIDARRPDICRLIDWEVTDQALQSHE